MQVAIDTFKGLIFSNIIGAEDGSREITFYTDGRLRYRMFHYQDCCEDVTLEDTCGDISDLINSPILEAECVTSDEVAPDDQRDDVNLWTFYKLGTIKGHVTLRWLGSSNGYYAVDVEINDLTRN